MSKPRTQSTVHPRGGVSVSSSSENGPVTLTFDNALVYSDIHDDYRANLDVSVKATGDVKVFFITRDEARRTYEALKDLLEEDDA